MPRRPTAIDLFCGCGGFSLGCIEAGFDVLLGVDNEPGALLAYVYNLGRRPVRWDGPEPWRNKRKTMPYAWWNYKTHRPVVGGKVSWKRTVRAVICRPVEELSGEDILKAAGVDEVDLVLGAPPCQGFSQAGKRRIGDPRDLLVFEFVRLVREINPKTVTMENVPQWMSKKLPSGVKVSTVALKLLREPWPTGPRIQLTWRSVIDGPPNFGGIE